MDERVVLEPLDPSRVWADALRGDGPTRTEALGRLREHLAATANFEFCRRGITVDDGQRQEAASFVQDAAEAALAAILADLDRYRAQSAFTTWTAKYAIREAAAVARRKSIAALPADGGGST